MAGLCRLGPAGPWRKLAVRLGPAGPWRKLAIREGGGEITPPLLSCRWPLAGFVAAGRVAGWPGPRQLAGVAAAARTAGLPLLVDEAHGGHLRYLDRRRGRRAKSYPASRRAGYGRRAGYSRRAV